MKKYNFIERHRLYGIGDETSLYIFSFNKKHIFIFDYADGKYAKGKYKLTCCVRVCLKTRSICTI